MDTADVKLTGILLGIDVTRDCDQRNNLFWRNSGPHNVPIDKSELSIELGCVMS